MIFNKNSEMIMIIIMITLQFGRGLILWFSSVKKLRRE